MKIYFNGCSHTLGSKNSVPNPDRDSFPQVVRRKLDLPSENVVVDAFRGGSNERIYRMTIEEYIQRPFDVAVLQWSMLDRFETPQSTKFEWHKQWMDPKGWMQHKAVSNLYHSRDQWFIPDRQFYKNHHSGGLTNDKDYIMKMTRKLCTQIIGVNEFLRNNDVKVLNISCVPIYGKMGFYVRNYDWVFNPSYDWIEQTIPSFGFLRLGEFTRTANGEIDGHYKADAHEWIADILIDSLQNGVKKIRPDRKGLVKYRKNKEKFRIGETIMDDTYREDWGKENG